MAMRAQFFPFATTITPGPVAITPTGDVQIPMMQTQLGRIQFTKATEFIVVDDIGATAEDTINVGGVYILPSLLGGHETAVQLKINTTEYFLNPDGSRTWGVPGRAVPYPRNNNFYQTFFLDPEVYVLPGQNWEVYLYIGSLAGEGAPLAYDAFVKYILYDGTDAVIANKLLEMGIAVKPSNIDWYKRMLIDQKGGA